VQVGIDRKTSMLAFQVEHQRKLEQNKKMAELQAKLKANPPKPTEEKKVEPAKPKEPPKPVVKEEIKPEKPVEQQENKPPIHKEEEKKEEPVNLAENTKKKLSLFDQQKLEKQKKMAEIEAKLKTQPPKPLEEKKEVPKPAPKKEEKKIVPPPVNRPEQPTEQRPANLHPSPVEEEKKEEPVNLAENTKKKLSLFGQQKLDTQKKMAEIEAKLKANPPKPKPPEENKPDSPKVQHKTEEKPLEQGVVPVVEKPVEANTIQPSGTPIVQPTEVHTEKANETPIQPQTGNEKPVEQQKGQGEVVQESIGLAKSLAAFTNKPPIQKEEEKKRRTGQPC